MKAHAQFFVLSFPNYFVKSQIIIVFRMQQQKTYTLKIQVTSIHSQLLHKDKHYILTCSKDLMTTQISDLEVLKLGEIRVEKRIQLCIPSSELRRDSICRVAVLQGNMQGQQKEMGKAEFYVMDYKNYSKSSFKLISKNKQQIGTIKMTVNIGSPTTTKRQTESKPTFKIVKFNEQINTVLQPPPQIGSKSKAPVQSINVSSKDVSSVREISIPEIKLICPSQYVLNKDPKSMFGAFENSGIVIATHKVCENQDESHKKPLSSMGELLEKKIEDKQDNTLKVPMNLAKSCRLSPNRSQNDSRYCKQIQQKLDNLSALDQQSNRLSYSRSPLKLDDLDSNIFQTLNRMKGKFQRIYEHEQILNKNQLGDLIQQNQQGDTQQREGFLRPDYCIQKDIFKSFNLKDRKNEQQQYLSKSAYGNLQVLSAASHIVNSSKHCSPVLKIIPVFSFHSKPHHQSNLNIFRTINLKMQVNGLQMIKDHLEQINLSKRYLLSKLPNVSAFYSDRVQSQLGGSRRNSWLSQTLINIEVEQESLKRTAYIKLNKITHLTRAADVFKRRNNFLIKANEELRVGQKATEQKLQISKKIISEKEDILSHQFLTVREQISTISQKLSLKNEQVIKRQEKISSLQEMVQNYVREINNLKAEIKARNVTIKQLKSMIVFKQDAEKRELVRKPTDIKDSITNKSQPKKQELQEKNTLLNILPMFQNSDKRPVSASRFLFQDKRQRKFSSIDNTLNNIKGDEGMDKSRDYSNKTYKKFSHSKNKSTPYEVEQLLSVKNKTKTTSDLIFEKITDLFTANGGNRLLKNL